jgi:hypothetical protein
MVKEGFAFDVHATHPKESRIPSTNSKSLRFYHSKLCLHFGHERISNLVG